jgi:hypothetical protein
MVRNDRAAFRPSTTRPTYYLNGVKIAVQVVDCLVFTDAELTKQINGERETLGAESP